MPRKKTSPPPGYSPASPSALPVAPQSTAPADPKARPDGTDDTFVPSALSQDLSDFEFSLFTLAFGFQTWTETCMAAADFRGLNSLDILVLHAVDHRARGRRQTEICMVLNIEDSHLVAYALKKLMAAELVHAIADGRERHFETTEKGEAACLAYRKVREAFLVPNLSWVARSDSIIRETAGFLKTMTALYSQAGRFATAATAGKQRSVRVRTKR
jgi:predicted MarR family transcription regulator